MPSSGSNERGGRGRWTQALADRAARQQREARDGVPQNGPGEGTQPQDQRRT